MHIIDVYNTYISKTCNKRIENYFIIHMIYASVNRTFYRLNSCSEKLFANVREKQQKSQNILCDVVNMRKKSTRCDTKMTELSLNKKSTKYVTPIAIWIQKNWIIFCPSHPYPISSIFLRSGHFWSYSFSVPKIYTRYIWCYEISYQLYKSIMLDKKDKIDHLKWIDTPSFTQDSHSLKDIGQKLAKNLSWVTIPF